MLKQIDMTLPPGTKLEAEAAMIDIYMDGKVAYNGQDITSPVQARCSGDVAAGMAAKQDEAGRKEDVKSVTEVSKPVPEEEIIWGEGH